MKKLKLQINDKDYLLEMNRLSIKWLEATGFNIEEFDKKPVTYYDMLWTSLFIANHKEVNPSLAIKLLEAYEENHKVAPIIKFAVEEYAAFMTALAGTNSMESEQLEIIEE